MSGTEDFERELRKRLHATELPGAPESLARHLEETTRTPHRQRGPGRSIALLAAAALMIGAGVLAAVGGMAWDRRDNVPTPAPTTAIAVDPTPRPASPIPTALQTPAFPAEVDGLPTYTVSELLDDRAAGLVSGGPIALVGYWSANVLGHSCAPPDQQPGELEIYCHDGEFGITERNELSVVLEPPSRLIPAEGPMLTPWISNELWRQLVLPPVNGQPYPPVPIVVVGHLDDPRAADCRPQARQRCADRFVVERIVSFDPGAVPTPGITPSPTPFPFDSPPPPLFGLSQCPAPPPYGFVGWIRGEDLGISGGVAAGEVVYAAVTRDAVQIGGWQTDGDGRRWRLWGRRACYAHEREAGLGVATVEGTSFRRYEDGSTAPPP